MKGRLPSAKALVGVGLATVLALSLASGETFRVGVDRRSYGMELLDAIDTEERTSFSDALKKLLEAKQPFSEVEDTSWAKNGIISHLIVTDRVHTPDELREAKDFLTICISHKVDEVKVFELLNLEEAMNGKVDDLKVCTWLDFVLLSVNAKYPGATPEFIFKQVNQIYANKFEYHWISAAVQFPMEGSPLSVWETIVEGGNSVVAMENRLKELLKDVEGHVPQ